MTCKACGYATPFSKKPRLCLCIHTGKTKKANDKCDVPRKAMNQWRKLLSQV